MFSGFKSVQRFSLLLLEEGENYLQEYVVECSWPLEVEGNWSSKPVLSGILRVCTKSIFFEPDDIRIPVVRIPLRFLQRLQPEAGKSYSIVTSGLTKMKANNADHPYVFLKDRESHWKFSLLYASFEQFHTLVTEQMALKDNEDMLQQRMQKRMDVASFDASRLVDFSETILHECAATHVRPLVHEPGKLVVTDQRLYFQPLNGITGLTVVLTHPLTAIVAVSRRRSALKSCGLEIFFVPPEDAVASLGVWDRPCAFFEFRSSVERESALELLLEKIRPGKVKGGILESKNEWLGKISRAWQYGKISNFDYILYLNLASGRTFNDLRQWPVFPWIIKDYTSPVLDLGNPDTYRDLGKPVGALNPERFATFRERFEQMPSDGFPPPFLYGTHYSTPGYVMFWLMRAAPAHNLQLQSGRFDSPDRMFHSIAEVWGSVTSNPADVKELIPEFYMANTDFLINQYNLALGKRQNGKVVNDVELPPWAKTPLEFLAINRAALESEYVSRHLHLWINLIFGCWQTGDAAIEADNVFYYLSYEGAVDVETVQDPIERKGLEAQINEFGQTPKQLFTAPHLTRESIPPTPDPTKLFIKYSPAADGDGDCNPCTTCRHSDNQELSLALLSLVSHVAESDVAEEPELERSPYFQMPSSQTAGNPTSIPGLPIKKIGTVHNSGELLWDFTEESRTVSSPDFTKLSMLSFSEPNRFNTSIHDGQLLPVMENVPSSMAYERSWSSLFSKGLHVKEEKSFLQGAVRAAAFSPLDGGTLYCAGDNATLKMFSLETGAQIRAARIERLSGKGIPLSDLDLLPHKKANMQPLALLGSYDNSVYAYSMELGRQIGFYQAHDEGVSVVRLMPGPNKGHQLITASLSGSVKVWRLSQGRAPWEGGGNKLKEAEIDIEDHEAAVVKVVPCSEGQSIISGTEEGVVTEWDLRSPTRPAWRMQHRERFVGGLAVLPDGHHVLCGFGDGSLLVWTTRKPDSIVASASLATSVHGCCTDGWISFHGQADGRVAVWDVARSLGVSSTEQCSGTIPGVDGFFPPLVCSEQSVVKTVCARRMTDLQGNEALWVAAAQDKGHISIFSSTSSQL